MCRRCALEERRKDQVEGWEWRSCWGEGSEEKQKSWPTQEFFFPQAPRKNHPEAKIKKGQGDASSIGGFLLPSRLSSHFDFSTGFSFFLSFIQATLKVLSLHLLCPIHSATASTAPVCRGINPSTVQNLNLKNSPIRFCLKNSLERLSKQIIGACSISVKNFQMWQMIQYRHRHCQFNSALETGNRSVSSALTLSFWCGYHLSMNNKCFVPSEILFKPVPWRYTGTDESTIPYEYSLWDKKTYSVFIW